MNDNSKLRAILARNCLNGSNYQVWFHCLRMVLKSEGKLYVLESSVPTLPSIDASREEHESHAKHSRDSAEVTTLLFESIESNVIEEDQYCEAYELMLFLRNRFSKKKDSVRLAIARCICTTFHVDGESVDLHVIFMRSLVERKNELGSNIDRELANEMILHSLSKSYDNFVQDFKRNHQDAPTETLHKMLVEYESSMNQGGIVLYQEKENQVKKDKGKEKVEVFDHSQKRKSKKKKKGTSKEGVVCFHCGMTGHWKRNCDLYLAELRQARASTTSASSMHDNFNMDEDDLLFDEAYDASKEIGDIDVDYFEEYSTFDEFSIP